MAATGGRTTTTMRPGRNEREGVGRMAGRKGREVAQVMRGEVVGPEPPMARPVPVQRRESGQVVHLHENHVHHHHAAQAPVVDRNRMAMLAAYAFGIAILLAVLVALIAAGVIDLHALRPPWQETGR